ncbi:TonB-dependent siderophore receptor [Vandammella animalimorsus]|uniref:TonB-dependent siderophore receptor n=1 Tax=Vandammella animalimorsus TaxID=2029117 RepID=A0A2A2AK27_9BURK|nr:TonB-dependent siderophore receptor [Vandammella animalimorsus]
MARPELRPLAAAAALSLAAALPAALPLPAQAQPAAAPAYQLPAQPLAQSLAALAAQAGLQLVADPARIGQRMAPALPPTADLPQALRALLAGSGLQGRVQGQTLVITPAPARPAAADAPAANAADAKTLPAVTVTAAPDLSGTTEGTRSFTTRAMSSATGLALSPRQTPQSVSVITRERIEAQGMSSLSDAVAAAPGVHSATVDGRGESYSARGFGLNAIQIDGVPMSWGSGWEAGESRNSLAIYDRVEVVRGATGLLTGAGDPSASVNLVRKRAEADTFTGHLQGHLGNRRQRGAMADLSTPLNASRSVRARIVAQATGEDGFNMREKANGKVFFATAEADLSPATRLTAGFDWQDNQRPGMPWRSLVIWHDDGSIIDWPRGYSLAPHWAAWNTQQKSAFANLEHHFGNDWRLKLDAQHIRNNVEEILSFTDGLLHRGSGLGLAAEPIQYDARRKQSNFTLNLQGPFHAWGRKHEAMLGLSQSRQDFLSLRTAGNDERPLGNAWTFDGNTPGPLPLNPPERVVDTVTKQRAAYGAVRLHVAEPLRLIAGARLTHWQQQSPQTAWNSPYHMRHPHVVTPYIGAVYDLGGSYSAYASATRIFNPQDSRDRHGRYLDPLKGQNLEAGMKAEWLGGQLNGSFALFQTTQDNFAVEDGEWIVPGTEDEQAYRAAKGVKTRGYELELVGRLAEGWDVGLGWTQLSSKNAQGERVQTSRPSRMLKLHTQYRLPGAWNKLTLGGGLYWQSGIHEWRNNPVLGQRVRLEQSAYALLNLSARYQFTPQLAAHLTVNNALDKTYWATLWRRTWGAPRSVMLTVDYRF